MGYAARDVQDFARHADPRTTAATTATARALIGTPTYTLAAFVAG